MDIQIEVTNVKLGMFVARLDRPWLGTPFRFQGFWVRGLDEIDNLRKHCASVWVRTDTKGRPTDGEDTSAVDWKERVVKADREARIIDFLPKKPVEHHDAIAVEGEFAAAHQARRGLCEALDEIVDDIKRDRKIVIAGLRDAVTGITDSIVRNPDACMWLRLVKDRDSYTYYHLLDTSALAIAFGRHLGFSRTELSDLGLGAMLIDIGKLRLPPELISKTGSLSDTELQIVRNHVEYGIELIQQAPGVTKRIIEIVATHHERFDGKGYPEGLRGRAIPPFARMASIADFFDAITSDKPYAAGISPHDAMRKLYDAADQAYQRELVEQFIQCIGIYPTGTLVELSTGEVGVIVGQNRVRRLKPRVMLVLNAEKKPLETFVELDLMENATGTEQAGLAVAITRSVEPEQFGIDPRQFYMSSERMTPEILRNISQLV
jgi:HD-GYP domain-containing protein (c-di-GMP phosphodiesterase class II)